MKDGKTMHTFLRKLACGATLVSALGVAAPAHALYINLTSTGNATADTGFRAAANIWQGVFTDNVTVNITAGFAALGTNILAQAGSSYFSTDYSTMKLALTADSTSAEDAIMVAGLPGGSSYSKLINNTTDNPGISHLYAGITALEMTTANAKALGLVGTNTIQDAAITFSSGFNFDFDASNGITDGFFDFVGIAIHEIGQPWASPVVLTYLTPTAQTSFPKNNSTLSQLSSISLVVQMQAKLLAQTWIGRLVA